MSEIPAVGLVGAGAMGQAMGLRLLEQGFRPVVYDVDQARVQSLVRAGATGASNPATVAELASTVLVVLPTPEAVEQAVTGVRGVASAVRSGTTVVDLTTSSPGVSRRMAAELGRKGASYLDAGVLGNPPTAAAGTMTLLLGGEQRDLDAARPALEAIAANLWLMGPAGAGHTAKLVANELFLAQVAAMGEALSVLEVAGVDPDHFLDALTGVGGRAVGLADIGRTMRSAPPPAGFALRLAAKDARLLAQMADDIGHPAPMAVTLRELYDAAAQQEPDADFTGVYRSQRATTGATAGAPEGKGG